MNKSVTLLSALLLWLTSIQCSHAAVMEDLFSVELPVADQTTTQRLLIFNEAFRQVVVKVSGSDEALEHPGFKRPLSNSSRYVLQFRYIQRKDENADAFEAGQLYLRVVFNKELVENLLRENDIPVWGKERPSTLLLINFDVNKKATLVSSDTSPDLVEEIDSLAQRQGLPVLFPLLDLEDRLVIGVQDIIDANHANMDKLASRYAPDAILSGQIVGRLGKGWHGQWQARFADRQFDWSFRGSARQEVLNQVIAQLAKILASEYALQTFKSFDQEILFSVDHVQQLTDQIRVLTYLQSLDAVETARLVLINGDKVTYRVKLRNTADDFNSIITLGYVLEQLELPQINAATDDPTVLMNYRLVR